MSFGDFSKSGRAPQRTNLTPTQPTIAEEEEEEMSSGGFAKISDGILQYQVPLHGPQNETFGWVHF
jgi:hypothetical protein